MLVPGTLRGRLIAGLVTLLAIACATVGLVTYLAVQNALSSQLTRELQTATGLAYSCWEQKFNVGKNDDDGGPQGDSRPGTTPTPGSSAAPSSPAAASSAPASSGSGGDGTSPFTNDISTSCPGLGEQTFVAVDWNGQWQKALVGDSKFTLTAADKASLLSIPPWQVQPAGATVPGNDAPTYPIYLSGSDSMYLLTVVRDPDGDGSVYYTGLSVSVLHDQLRDVAVAEAIVFGAVLLFAGVLGTLWVRFSLRPLRRVATTATQVAELPLESGVVSLPAGVPDTDPTTETGQLGLAFNRMLGHVETALRHRAASESRLRKTI